MLNMQFAPPVSGCLAEHWGDSIFTFALPCIMVSWEKRCIHLRMKGEKKLNKKKRWERETLRDGMGEGRGLCMLMSEWMPLIWATAKALHFQNREGEWLRVHPLGMHLSGEIHSICACACQRHEGDRAQLWCTARLLLADPSGLLKLIKAAWSTR